MGGLSLFYLKFEYSIESGGKSSYSNVMTCSNSEMYTTNKLRPCDPTEGVLKLHYKLDLLHALLTLDLSIQLVILCFLLGKWVTLVSKAVLSGQSRQQNIWEVVYGSILDKAAVLLSNDNKSADSPSLQLHKLMLAGERTTSSDCLLLGALSFSRPFGNSS